MITEQILTANNEIKLADALAATEKLGNESGLDRKSVLHLRLLAEELFGLLRGIAGNVEASYWVEAENKAFEVNMKAQIDLTEEMRKRFISASSSGKNSAAAGFTGKLRVMIANILFSAKETIPYAMINTAAAYTAGSPYEGSSYVWTMAGYKAEIKKNAENSQEASEARDELEKSILANIADDIKVSIAGKTVQITVYKNFN